MNSSVALFILDSASEIVFEGDTGETSPSSLPSRRYGVEWTNDYRPVSWIDFQGDIAATHSRFIGFDQAQADLYQSLAGFPGVLIGNAPGTYIPGAAVIASAGITLGEKTGWFGGLRYRYFGARPLTEDGTFKSPPTGLLNGQVGYRFDNGWRIELDAYNLTNSRSDQITYAYGTLLTTDALYAKCYPVPTISTAVCQAGIMDRVLHPVEPLAFRVTLAGSF